MSRSFVWITVTPRMGENEDQCVVSHLGLILTVSSFELAIKGAE
jgi:hypothetical protein